MTIHHATLKKAEKSGIVMRQLDGVDTVEARWPERNKVGFAFNAAGAPALLDDMVLLRMLALEYPQLTVKQPKANKGDYSWTISLRGDKIGHGLTLADAWELALDVLQGPEGDEQKPAKAKKARKVADDEEGDDEIDEDAEDGGGEDGGGEDGGGEDDEEPSEGKSVVKKKYKTKYRPFKMTCGDELSQQISAHVTVKDEDGDKHIDRAKLEKFAKANGVWDPKYKTMGPGFQRMNIGNRLRGKIRRDKHVVIWG